MNLKVTYIATDYQYWLYFDDGAKTILVSTEDAFYTNVEFLLEDIIGFFLRSEEEVFWYRSDWFGYEDIEPALEENGGDDLIPLEIMEKHLELSEFLTLSTKYKYEDEP